MNALIKTSATLPRLQSALILITLVLAGLGLLPRAQAVSPPPGGGYFGFNTAEGQNALFSLDTSTGLGNTAVGSFSLKSDVNGSFNTGIGAGTLLFNTGDTSTGDGTENTTGSENTAVGVAALSNNTTASGNTAIGSNALLGNTTGGTLGTTQTLDVGPNTAVGDSALVSNTIASANTAVGYEALARNTSGLQDTDLGLSTAVGFQALANATGPGAGFNDALGYQALFNLNAGVGNVAIGGRALFASTIGSSNVALGNQAGVNITTGNQNICIGFGAGLGLTTGSNNIRIGDASSENEDDTIRIGRGGVQTKTIIAGISGTVIPGGTAVVIGGSDDQLGVTPSSRRFKEEIAPMEKASEAILALKPVTFHYKNDNIKIPQFGLIAEEVAEVNPDLVIRDKNGEIYTVRYDAVNAMLLNEFLKEHKRVREQQSKIDEQQGIIAELKSTVAQQQKDMKTVIARVEEQAAQIQKVNAQIEMNKSARRTAGRIHRGCPAPQLVVNP